MDAHQDWLLLSGSGANGWTNLTFTRKWVTGDSRDRDVLVRAIIIDLNTLHTIL